MLRLVEVEFYKLRRKKVMWMMLLAALVMPFFAFLYFGYLGKKNIEPVLFYKWSAFGFTLFLILPFILGLLSIMLLHDENRYDMLKQLWIVPVSKAGYFFGKFFMVFLYSLCFMMINAAASVLFSNSQLCGFRLEEYCFFGGKMFGDCRIDCFCDFACFRSDGFSKRIYFSYVHNAHLYFCRIFYNACKFLFASAFLYFRNYLQRRSNSGGCTFRTKSSSCIFQYVCMGNCFCGIGCRYIG